MKLSCTTFLAVALFTGATMPASAQIQGEWTATGPLQKARELHAQVRLANGEAMAIGGIDGSGNILASAEIFSPVTRVWSVTGSMAHPRYYSPAAVLANGNVLVAGGLGTGGVVLAAAEIFNPLTGAWSHAGNLSVARFAHTTTLLANGTVLVTGGCTASGCGTSTGVSELYDPVSNSWSTTGSLNTPRHEQTAVKLKDGRVLVVGGIAGAVTSSAELYNPSTGAWTSAAGMKVARYQHTTTLLADGKVLVTGGTLGRYPMNSAEVYDPASNAWTLTGLMKLGRYAHTATLLGDGTVVVAGGIGQSISCGKACTGYIPTARAEVFTETTGAFAAASSLIRAQAYQATTLVGTGQAISAGGVGYYATCCFVLADSGWYTPLTMNFTPTGLNFGVLQLGLKSPAQTVTVKNVSAHAAQITGIASSGDYQQTNDCPALLAAGLSCTITTIFQPAAGGTRSGAITLKDNDPGSPTQTIALTGIGESLALSFQPAALNFGGIAVGLSVTQAATLINDGSASVAISGISVSTTGTTYVQTNDCPATLAVQQTCTIQVTFTPPDVFAYKATVSVTNGAGNPATLTVTGQGLDGNGG